MKRYVNLNRKGSPNSAGAIRSRKLQRKNISVNTNELREIALLNRTKAELWAESIIKERFKNEEFEFKDKYPEDCKFVKFVEETMIEVEE